VFDRMYIYFPPTVVAKVTILYPRCAGQLRSRKKEYRDAGKSLDRPTSDVFCLVARIFRVMLVLLYIYIYIYIILK
jgi:hypothetical protein